jgi:ABC-type spermidine/putrescine transport system permease subunit I
MTWETVAVVASVFLACIAFGLTGGWWLARMTDRTTSFWPLAVVLVAAFVFAVGLTAAIAQLDLS